MSERISIEEENMDNRLLNGSLPQMNTAPFVAQYRAAVSAAQIQLSVTANISVPEGFRRNTNAPVTWNLSADQHNLSFYVSEQLSASGTVQYELKVSGELFYHLALTGLTPVAPIDNACCTVAFTASGGIPINQVIGVYNSIAEVQNIIQNVFSITVALGTIQVVLPDGTVVVYDPANPEAFYSLFNGEQALQFIAQVEVIVNTTPEPVS